MELTIRTVHVNRNVKVQNVPVYSCPVCGDHQLIEQTTSLMKDMVEEADHLNSNGENETIPFEERSELAQLLLMAYYLQEMGSENESMQQDVEELLDELILNRNVEESYWKEDIKKTIEKYVQ